MNPFCVSFRPPLGLTPLFIHEERRMKEIIGAMQRYSSAGIAIPTEWVDELSEILAKRFPSK